MLNWIRSGPGRLLADWTACRSDPGPVSAVLLTTNVAGRPVSIEPNSAARRQGSEHACKEGRYIMDCSIKPQVPLPSPLLKAAGQKLRLPRILSHGGGERPMW